MIGIAQLHDSVADAGFEFRRARAIGNYCVGCRRSGGARTGPSEYFANQLFVALGLRRVVRDRSELDRRVGCVEFRDVRVDGAVGGEVAGAASRRRFGGREGVGEGSVRRPLDRDG